MKSDVFLDSIVINAIEKGCRELLDIASFCGIYPNELKALLDELIQQHRVAYSKNSGYSVVDDIESSQFRLPPPHPLDFDWRFDKNTTINLTEKILDECGNENAILLLGTHSIQMELYRRQVANKVILYDSNSGLIEDLDTNASSSNFICIRKDLFNTKDLVQDYDLGEIGVVFMDPPWYLDFYLFFLTFAARTVKPGGAVFVSLLPIGTRKTACREREKIFAHAKICGLHLEQLHKNGITYVTPEFEKKSLSTMGIKNVGNWRKGDMVVFRKIRYCKNYPDLKVIDKEIRDNNWLSFAIKGFPVKIRKDENDKRVPRIVKIEKNNILPTVSRRYKGRDKIDLWLWDNRVFGIEGKTHFITALYSLSQTEIPIAYNTMDEKMVDMAILLLKDILKDIL